MKIVKYLLFITVLIFIYGCAPKITSIHGDSESIKLSLDSEADEMFLLKDSKGNTLSHNWPEGKEVYFKLDYYYPDKKKCLHVESDKNIIKFDNNKKFFVNNMWYWNNQLIYNKEKFKSFKKRLNEALKEQGEIQERLINNRAFQNSSCYIPPMKKIPDRPQNSCTIEEGKKEANDFCNNMESYIELCKDYYSHRNNNMEEGKLERNCYLFVSFLNRNTDFAEAFLRQIKGTLAEKGVRNLREGGLWGSLIGFVQIATSEGIQQALIDQCKDKYFSQCREQYINWAKQVRQIKSEPRILYEKCKNDINELENIKKDIKSYKENIYFYQTQYQNLQQKKPYKAIEIIDSCDNI